MSLDAQPDPSLIGRALPPPYLRMPDPTRLFAERAQRFAELSEGHGLKGYLALLSGFAAAQDEVVRTMPAPVVPPVEARQAAKLRGVAPLARRAQAGDAALFETIRAFFDAVDPAPLPDQAQTMLARVKTWSQDDLAIATGDVLANSIPLDGPAAHALVACGAQVHFARLAAQIEPREVARTEPGLCPVCGAPPVSSLVVGWPGAENARYCCCSLCASLWNAVRVKCVICESTAGIGYREIEGGEGVVKAECCSACHAYIKVLYSVRAPSLDAVADDVASLDLDLLLREQPYRRASFNPLMLGV